MPEMPTLPALPEDVATAITPLLELLPLDQAMTQLVVKRGGTKEQVALVQKLVNEPAIKAKRSLAAGLWLYIDELDRSHDISQVMKNSTGSYWHGIMHRLEGDFGNSHYWFRNTGHHPAMDDVAEQSPGYDGHAFVDQVAEAYRASGNAGADADILNTQRQEWATLFAWCAEHGE